MSERLQAISAPYNADLLIIAGGGSGGGGPQGGGGGAGGYLAYSAQSFTPGDVKTVTVGAGGANGTGTGPFPSIVRVFDTYATSFKIELSNEDSSGSRINILVYK